MQDKCCTYKLVGSTGWSVGDDNQYNIVLELRCERCGDYQEVELTNAIVRYNEDIRGAQVKLEARY